MPVLWRFHVFLIVILCFSQPNAAELDKESSAFIGPPEMKELLANGVVPTKATLENMFRGKAAIFDFGYFGSIVECIGSEVDTILWDSGYVRFDRTTCRLEDGAIFLWKDRLPVRSLSRLPGFLFVDFSESYKDSSEETKKAKLADTPPTVAFLPLRVQDLAPPLTRLDFGIYEINLPDSRSLEIDNATALPFSLSLKQRGGTGDGKAGAYLEYLQLAEVADRAAGDGSSDERHASQVVMENLLDDWAEGYRNRFVEKDEHGYVGYYHSRNFTIEALERDGAPCRRYSEEVWAKTKEETGGINVRPDLRWRAGLVCILPDHWSMLAVSFDLYTPIPQKRASFEDEAERILNSVRFH